MCMLGPPSPFKDYSCALGFVCGILGQQDEGAGSESIVVEEMDLY